MWIILFREVLSLLGRRDGSEIFFDKYNPQNSALASDLTFNQIHPSQFEDVISILNSWLEIQWRSKIEDFFKAGTNIIFMKIKNGLEILKSESFEELVLF